MKALTNAVYTALSGNATITTAFPGGFYRDLGPGGTGTPTMPYLVWTIIAAPVTSMYGGTKRTDVTIRFTAFGEGHDAVLTAMETLTAQLDDTPLTLSTGQNYDCLRTTEPFPMQEPAIDQSANVVWMCPVTYIFRVR